MALGESELANRRSGRGKHIYDSEIQQTCRKIGVTYVGIHADMQNSKTSQAVVRMLGPRKKLYAHVSLPCVGGSPLLNFVKGHQGKAHLGVSAFAEEVGRIFQGI